MAVDMYDSRVMIAAMEMIPSASTFLRDRFFKNVVQSLTKYIDIDIVKGKRRVAVYVKPIQRGHVVEKGGFETKTYEAPYIKEKIPTTAYELLKRDPGQNMYSTTPPATQAANKLNKELTELDTMITRAEEIQCAQAMLDGKVVAKNEDGVAIQEVDFGLEATHKLGTGDVGTLWSVSTFKKNALLAKLREWRTLVIKDSGRAPTDVIMGSDVAAKTIAILDPDADNSGLSSIRVTRGQIDPQNLPNGVTYWGYLKDINCDLWSYDEWYWNGTADVPIFHPKKIWMGSNKARFDRNYAVIQDLKSLAAVSRFPKVWEEDTDISMRWLMMQSAPLMAPHEINSMLVAQVLADD